MKAAHKSSWLAWSLAAVVLLLNPAVVRPDAPVKAGEVVLPPVVRYLEIETVHNGPGKGDTLFARLLRCTDATITLSLTQSENVVSSVPLPMTVEARGRQYFELVTIRPADAGKVWRYRYHFDSKTAVRSDLKSSPYPYTLPYTGRFKVTQGFAGKISHLADTPAEYAIDWAMPEGTEVLAARGGEVIALRADVKVNTYSPEIDATLASEGNDPRFFVNFVTIKHADGTCGLYLHFQPNGVLVSLGQKVKAGDVIGHSGNTGFSKGPHLHFQVFCSVDGTRSRTMPFQFKLPSGTMETLKAGAYY